MNYGWKHLGMQVILVALQFTAFMMGHMTLALVLGVCHVPFLVRIIHTLFSKEKIG